MSRINLSKFIAEQYKGGVSARDVLREAVTNSIHAGGRNISIDLKFSDKQDEFFPDVSGRSFLEEISVSDDGEGFTDLNIDYFEEVCTDHKDGMGGKGIGRLSFLKYAGAVKVESQLDGVFVRFDYTPDFKKGDVKKIDSVGVKKTVITLSKLKDQINTHVKNLILSLCDDLRLLVFLRHQAGETIVITFSHNSKQAFNDQHSLSGGDIKTSLQGEFNLNGQVFNFYLFKDELPARGIAAVLCVDDFVIEEHVISRKFDSCRYQFSVTSDYFKTRSSLDRKVLALPKSEQDIDMVSPISRPALMKRIHEECMRAIAGVDSGEIESFKRSNIDKLKKYYPFVDIKSLGGAASLLDAEEMVKLYRAQQSRKEDQIIESLQQGDQPSWDDLSHLASEDLARFVVHRALVIDSLDRMPKDSVEDLLHKAILPKKYKGAEIKDNNIWLVDDKFLSYSSIFSDETLSRIIEDVNSIVEKGQNRKPDVAAFFSRDSSEKPNKLVIVEFKKPSADFFDNSKALVQCRHYASELVKRIPSVREVFAFAIVEIDDDFYQELKQTNYKDIFSLEERVMYNDFPIGDSGSVPLHLYVMPASALIDNAKARNKVFEDILKFNVEEDFKKS
jgi:hypothetical protein